jgi:hypothetical protein
MWRAMADLHQSILLPRSLSRDGIIARIAKVLAALPMDKAWRVDIVLQRSKRSAAQNAYLWGCVYPTILKHGGETLAGWLDKDLHDHLLGEFSGTERLCAFGKTYEKPLKRSSSMSKLEFMDYIAFIQQYMAGLGCFIPDPDPEWFRKEAA